MGKFTKVLKRGETPTKQIGVAAFDADAAIASMQKFVDTHTTGDQAPFNADEVIASMRQVIDGTKATTAGDHISTETDADEVIPAITLVVEEETDDEVPVVDLPLTEFPEPIEFDTSHPEAAEPPGDTPDEPPPRIGPAYTQTRRISCDPLVLEANKIIASCQGEEIGDQLKILRTQVMNKMREIGANSLLVTSATAGEGKTFTAINLAISIAHEVDSTVLLVDANLRDPKVHEYFGVAPQGGLSDYLLGRGEIPELLINPGIHKLVVLPAGHPLPNSSELLGSAQMQSLAEEMKARYADRFIIYDSSSLLASADPQVLSRYIDCVLLVVEEEKTPERNVKRALELLEERQLIGIVLNKQKGL